MSRHTNLVRFFLYFCIVLDQLGVGQVMVLWLLTIYVGMVYVLLSKKKKLWIKYKEFNLMVVGIVSDIINLLGHKFMQMSMTP